MGILNRLTITHHIDSEKSLFLLKQSNYKVIKHKKLGNCVFIIAVRKSVGVKHFISILQNRTIDRISKHQDVRIPKNIFKKDFYSENENDCFFNLSSNK